MVSVLSPWSRNQAPALAKTKKSDIPTPNVVLVPDYTRRIPATYRAPTSFVRHVVKSSTEFGDSVEYNVDGDDDEWLTKNMIFGPRAGWIPIGDGGGRAGGGSDRDLKKEGTANPAGAASVMNGSTGTTAPDPAEAVAATAVPSSEDAPMRLRPPLPHLAPPTLSLRHLEQMLDLLEKATGFETIVTKAEAERIILGKIPSLGRIFRARPPPGDAAMPTGCVPTSTHAALAPPVTARSVITEVYTYWVNKRSKLRKPLLRRYWPVTNANDTNPHLVFRPREKEKYKLRRKRTNDMESYRKMRQLRADFDRLLTLIDIVVRRERLFLVSLQLGCEYIDQRIYDCVDTSGLPRLCQRLDASDVACALSIPKRFDTVSLDSRSAGSAAAAMARMKGKKRKRGSTSVPGLDSAAQGGLGGVTPSPVAVEEDEASLEGEEGGEVVRTVAEEVDGFSPVPNFLEPLQSRESPAAMDLKGDGAASLPGYVNSHPDAHRKHVAPMSYTRRPRVARGGRIVFDRVPLPTTSGRICYTAGAGSGTSGAATASAAASSSTDNGTKPLFRLLPKPLDYDLVSRRIEHVCAEAIGDDDGVGTKGRQTPSGAFGGNVSALAAAMGGAGEQDEADENDGEAMLVSMDDWLCTDDQLWGEERFSAGL